MPTPGELDPAKLGAGAKALATEACEAYRTAWDSYRRACADHHARPALRLLDELLRRFAAEYADGKAERAAVDFDDLELGVRDLLADDAERRRWSERFALLMVDEFQDTNRLQLDLLEGLERGNLFAVGDEFQSIYRFRHADVEIFRERRAKLDAARVRAAAGQLPLGARAPGRPRRGLRPRVRRGVPAARRRPPARGGACGGRRR